MGVCVGDKESSRHAGSLLTTDNGSDGSRTRVQKPIPCPSTSLVCYLTFPLPHENRHPYGFSSFMLRPQVQSLACVVSHIVEAWILRCECLRSDCCNFRQLLILYCYQRLILILEFNASPATRFSSFMIPVETITSPCYVFAKQKYNSCFPLFFA